MTEIFFFLIIIIIIFLWRFDRKATRDISYSDGFTKGYAEAKSKLIKGELAQKDDFDPL